MTFNRPARLTAVNWDLASDLVLTGAGNAFCSGGDARGISKYLSEGYRGKRVPMFTETN